MPEWAAGRIERRDRKNDVFMMSKAKSRLVQAAIADEVVSHIQAMLPRFQPADPLAPSTVMGARVDEFIPSMYGDATNSPLQGDMPTDRFVIAWSVDPARDAVVICERPRISPHVERMRQNVADDTGLALDAINIKAANSAAPHRIRMNVCIAASRLKPLTIPVHVSDCRHRFCPS